VSIRITKSKSAIVFKNQIGDHVVILEVVLLLDFAATSFA